MALREDVRDLIDASERYGEVGLVSAFRRYDASAQEALLALLVHRLPSSRIEALAKAAGISGTVDFLHGYLVLLESKDVESRLLGVELLRNYGGSDAIPLLNELTGFLTAAPLRAAAKAALAVIQERVEKEAGALSLAKDGRPEKGALSLGVEAQKGEVSLVPKDRDS